jgi:hypothetical protein
MQRTLSISLASVLTLGVVAFAQVAPTTVPTTGPATRPIDDYERLLGSPDEARDRPLLPQNRSTIDRSTGGAVVPLGAPEIPTKREGTFVVDRVGRLAKTADGQAWEFIYSADGASMQDPPLRVLPNLKLQTIEDELATANRDLKLRISGTLTEYRGRNYVLLEKVIVVRDPT